MKRIIFRFHFIVFKIINLCHFSSPFMKESHFFSLKQTNLLMTTLSWVLFFMYLESFTRYDFLSVVCRHHGTLRVSRVSFIISPFYRLGRKLGKAWQIQMSLLVSCVSRTRACKFWLWFPKSRSSSSFCLHFLLLLLLCLYLSSRHMEYEIYYSESLKNEPQNNETHTTQKLTSGWPISDTI